MSAKLTSPKKVSFEDEEMQKPINYKSRQDKEKGVLSTQESEDEGRFTRRGNKSGAQGEFSGNYDKEGHHLKSDGTPDMRFKENIEEFRGQGYEYTTSRQSGGRPISRTGGKSVSQGEFSGNYDQESHHLKFNGTPDMRFKENREEYSGKGLEGTQDRTTSPTKIQTFNKPFKKSFTTKLEERKSRSKISDKFKYTPSRPSDSKSKPALKNISRKTETKFSDKSNYQSGSKKSEHFKNDGTPDMRYKENRENFSGQGYENTTAGTRYRMSKANLGMYEGNVPGEHSGKFDKKGHHLKNDGTPDMRFKENREEYSGQGYEYPVSEKGYTIRTPKYLMDEDISEKNLYYRRRRPPTPYALYVKDRASDMKKENPDTDMNEIFRILGEEWQGSSEEYKKKYYEMYDKEVKKYEESYSPGHHRGPLSMLLLAERKGHIPDQLKYSAKRGKYGRGSITSKETLEEEEENQDQIYNPEIKSKGS